MSITVNAGMNTPRPVRSLARARLGLRRTAVLMTVVTLGAAPVAPAQDRGTRGDPERRVIVPAPQAPPADNTATKPAVPTADGSVGKDAPAAPARQDSGEATEATEALSAPRARVLEVRGDVSTAPAGTSELTDEAWTPVQVGALIEPGTKVRTGLRSYVHLQFGPDTFVSIERATSASIDEFYRSATEQTVHIGLGYGSIRGGSTEHTFRSNVVVDSPIATLAKRGTEGWRITVEPQSGHFNISLAQYGLVEAFQKLGADRLVHRLVRPGEYATDRNIASMWLRQDIFDRAIHFFNPEGMTPADVRFSTNNTTGLGMTAPGGGSTLMAFARRDGSTTVRVRTLATRVRPPVSRPEGNFGVRNPAR